MRKTRWVSALIGALVSLALGIVALIVDSGVWSTIGALFLVMFATVYLVEAAAGIAVPSRSIHLSRQAPHLWFARAMWTLAVLTLFILIMDSVITEHWSLTLIYLGMAVMVFSEGLPLWRESSQSSEANEDVRIYGAILVVSALSAGVYIIDDAPSLTEAASIKAAVTRALGARKSAIVTPGELDELTPLSSEQLDEKYSDAEAWLSSLFTGSILERQVRTLPGHRDDEQGRHFRYVGGGAHVLDWTSVTIDGDTARATGWDEEWLDTAIPDADGHYTVHRTPPTHYTFTVDLTKTPEHSWLVTNSVTSRDINGR
ncbi:hypothetical protein LQL77_30480 [Rhodococcus cerastii]|nr:hypothetical protein [Rhodococcus cerastii]